jgi:hypothetical protein
MAEKIQLKSTTSEFAANEISKLADRPNQSSTYGEGGLSASALKTRFDALSKILRDDVKAIADTLSSSQAANYIGLDGSVNGKTSLAELLQGINTGGFSEDLQVEYLSEEGETKIPLNTAIALLQIANSQLNEKVDLLPTTGGRNYIDLYHYQINGVIDYQTFNDQLARLAAQSKGENDRVDIYFYNSREGSVYVSFPWEASWKSNCNYYYLITNNYDPPQDTGNITLRGVKNCRFYGFTSSVVGSGASLYLYNCENVEFYDCRFINTYQTAIRVSDCKNIYFNDCYVMGGDYPSQQPLCLIEDLESVRNWIIFENCEFEQKTESASTPLFDCSSVKNTKSVLFVLHCITNSNNDISASSFSNGSGKIRISALTSV